MTGALRVHSDGFVAAAGPHFIRIRPVVGGRVEVSRLFRAETDVVPVVDATAADPDRVAFDPDAVAPRGGDAETAPAKSAGIGEDARDTADGLALFGFRIRDGAAAGADVRLSVRIENGEAQPVGAGVALTRPEVAHRGLLARVDASGGGGGLDEFRGHGLAQGVIGGTHVPGELNMRDIERCADLVEAPGLAVLRQFGFDLDPRDVEKVADRVLVFVGVEAAKSGAAALGGDGTFVSSECGVQAIDELAERFGGGPRDGRRGHLTCGDAVMNFDPDSEIIRVAGFIGELGEVESCGGGRGVVACGAVLLNEGVGARERWTRSHAASSEKSGSDGNSRRDGSASAPACCGGRESIDQTRLPRSPGGESRSHASRTPA